MLIIFFDGSTMEANEIEFTNNGKIIVDEYRIIDTVEIIRIIHNH